jgi:RNA polymerase sigma-70 factor (ECF subfamily)
MNPNADTERKLVEKCRQGDREAQREIYAQTSDRIYGLLLRMTHNPDDAFELAQETYIRAFAHIHTFDGASSVATWIYQIALNEARQFLRRRKRYAEKLSELEQQQSRSSVETPADNRMDIEQALAQMPEEEREMIVLRHYEEMSYAEMAKVLNKPEGTIASGLNRAREMLRGFLESNS